MNTEIKETAGLNAFLFTCVVLGRARASRNDGIKYVHLTKNLGIAIFANSRVLNGVTWHGEPHHQNPWNTDRHGALVRERGRSTDRRTQQRKGGSPGGDGRTTLKRTRSRSIRPPLHPCTFDIIASGDVAVPLEPRPPWRAPPSNLGVPCS